MARGLQAAVAMAVAAALVALLFGGTARRGAAAQQGVGQPSLIRKSCPAGWLFQGGMLAAQEAFAPRCFQPQPNPLLPLLLPLPPPPAEPTLLAVRNAITNWPDFAAANNISGWGGPRPQDKGVPACLWTGVTCDADGRLSGL